MTNEELTNGTAIQFEYNGGSYEGIITETDPCAVRVKKLSPFGWREWWAWKEQMYNIRKSVAEKAHSDKIIPPAQKHFDLVCHACKSPFIATQDTDFCRDCQTTATIERINRAHDHWKREIEDEVANAINRVTEIIEKQVEKPKKSAWLLVAGNEALMEDARVYWLRGRRAGSVFCTEGWKSARYTQCEFLPEPIETWQEMEKRLLEAGE